MQAVLTPILKTVCWFQVQKQLQAAQQAAADKAEAMLKSHDQQLEEVRQDRDKMQRSIGLRDTALKALRQEVDDVLREDAEKAAGLEEVIEELERLQQSEAGSTQQLASSQQHLQVGLLLPLRLLVHSCGSVFWGLCQGPGKAAQLAGSQRHLQVGLAADFVQAHSSGST